MSCVLLTAAKGALHKLARPGGPLSAMKATACDPSSETIETSPESKYEVTDSIVSSSARASSTGSISS